MSQTARSLYYQALKETGVEFAKPYREYSTAELKELHEARGLRPIALPAPERDVPAAPPAPANLEAKLDQLSNVIGQLVSLQLAQAQPAAAPPPQYAMAPGRAAQPAMGAPEPPTQRSAAPYEIDRGLAPGEHAGLNSNTHGKDDVLFVDEQGNEWYQREVNKPGYAKPRGRRVLRTHDTAVVQKTVKIDDTYTETFEVSGDVKNSTPTEIKVTLPSYQCGIYKPANMPFKVHTYNGLQGFDREDVQAYYGGRRLVPATIKDKYVHMDWCYDIESVIQTIEAEYRERVLGTTVNQRGL